jgi:hypothetical protein
LAISISSPPSPPFSGSLFFLFKNIKKKEENLQKSEENLARKGGGDENPKSFHPPLPPLMSRAPFARDSSI